MFSVNAASICNASFLTVLELCEIVGLQMPGWRRPTLNRRWGWGDEAEMAQVHVSK